MAGVFISYRREDTPAHAGRLYERLASRYGKRRVFRDLDAIPIAKDFRERINEAISSCDALIAVIGRDWLTVSDSSGQPKLHNPRDWLTVEIATALRMNKVVIPVLVENADMPSEDALPDPLKPVAYIHALKTSEQDWDYHVGLLIRTIEDNTDLRPGDIWTTVAYALMIAGIAARIVGGLQTIDQDSWFVSADLALVALLSVILALLVRQPGWRLLAAGMVVGSGIGTFLRFGHRSSTARSSTFMAITHDFVSKNRPLGLLPDRTPTWRAPARRAPRSVQRARQLHPLRRRRDRPPRDTDTSRASAPRRSSGR
jgi:TIR domain